MIYLIGGPPKCGKTTFAKKLSQEIGVSWISTDTLQCVIREYIDQENDKEKFPASHQRMKSNDEKYSLYSTEEIYEAYRKQAQTVSVGMFAFIESEISAGNDHIIEGYHIEPELVVQLSRKYSDQLKSIFLFKLDEIKFISDFKKSTTYNDWIIARTHQEETYPKIAHMICEYGKIFKNEAEKHDLNYLCMDDDFENQIRTAIHLLTSKNING